MFIIIPKPNKTLYDTLKAFQPIVLLNILGKLIEKVISSRLQFHSIVFNFNYPNQLEGIKQCSTIDTSIFLTYLIYTEWVKGLHTSTLVFDIVQFFPFLNHYLLPIILTKVGFDSNISLFFYNYLINRQIQYIWNNYISPCFNADIGVRQSSALSPILSVLYITPIFHILGKETKNLSIPIPIFFLSFVDNSLLISQKNFFDKSNANLFCSYNNIFSLFKQLRLVIEHDKSEVFHFSRLRKNFNPPP